MKAVKFFGIVLISLLVISKLSAQTRTVVSITGNVYNEVTKEPISVNLDVFDETGKKITRVKSNSQDGYYFITGLTPGKKYCIRNFLDLSSPMKLFRHKFEIVIPNTDQYAEFSKDIQLKPMEVNQALPYISSIFSSANKTNLRPGAEFVLQSNLEIMKENPKVKFEISVYPDNDGNSQNETITKARAQSIKDYYVSQGIDESRLEIKGNSSVDPKHPPKTGKASKGKKYRGSVYLIIKGLM